MFMLLLLVYYSYITRTLILNTYKAKNIIEIQTKNVKIVILDMAASLMLLGWLLLNLFQQKF